MLVKRSIVEHWYQPQSSVYKNFAYLFKNPWWDKPMPNGFSVCPYFWLSLFSLLLLRPAIFVVNRIAVPVLKVFGAPGLWVDGFVRRRMGIPAAPKGVGFVMLVLWMLLVFAVWWLTKTTLVPAAQWYRSNLANSSLANALLFCAQWPILAGLANFWMYAHDRAYLKRKQFIVAWAVVTLITLFAFAPLELHAGMKLIVTTAGEVIAACALFVAGWAVIIGKFLWKWLLVVLDAHFTIKGFVFPYWTAVVFVLFGSISLLDTKWGRNKMDKLIDWWLTHDYTEEWYALLMETLEGVVTERNIVDHTPKRIRDNDTKLHAMYHLLDMVKRDIAFKYLYTLAHRLRHCKPSINRETLAKDCNYFDGILERMENLRYNTEDDRAREIIAKWMKSHTQKKLVRYASYVTRTADYKAAFDSYLSYLTAKNERREARYNSPLFHFGRSVAACWLAFWRWCGHVCKNIGVGCVYGWMLIKSFKTKACPYFTFKRS
jgi:hypothetical protein